MSYKIEHPVTGHDPCERDISAGAVQQQLKDIEQATGQKSAIIYVDNTRGTLRISGFFAEGDPVTHQLPIGALQLEAAVNGLRGEVAPLTAGGRLDIQALQGTSYLPFAQELYRLLITPIEAELKARNISVLGTIPSLNLTQISYLKDLRGSRMLAMGASEWESRGFKGVPDLPAVPLELNLVAQNSGLNTKTFLNPQFTTSNLLKEREAPVRVVHLATHGQFKPGQANQSFIRFWDSQVKLNQIRDLQLNLPAVDLLTLSACETAAGDDQAELGFAGMAIATGAKTTLASLWYVSDVSTMALMTSFYRNLQTATTKAQALQQTQIAMLKGQVRISGNQLILPNQTISLPPEQAGALAAQLTGLKVQDFRHPYFWSPFTMVGSPW